MKRLFIIPLIAIFFLSFITEPSIYDLTIYTVDQKAIKLDVFKGKKMLFISLPVDQWNEDLIQDINSFSKRYRDKIAIIGITSRGKSHSVNIDSISTRLKSGLTKDIILAPASYFHIKWKDSTHNLLEWLTDKNFNKHFDIPDYHDKRFFIDEQGELYAVTKASIPLMSDGIERIVNKVRKN